MFWAIFLLLGGSTVEGIVADYLCDSMPAGLPNGPPFPTLPQQYEATIEVNIANKMMSFLVHEAYDYPNKMAAVHMTSYNMTTGNIVNFNSGERYSFAPNGTCQSYRNNDSSPYNIFGFLVRGRNGSIHFGSSADVFRFGRTYNEVYVGQDVIRGIPVDHWASCQHSDELHATFRLDYYFSRDQFLSPTNNTNIPIRVLIKGHALNEDPQGNLKSTGSHNFSHTYEYSYFKPGPIKDQSVFHTPKGVVCKGRKDAKSLPRIPDQFTMDTEILYQTPMKNNYLLRELRIYFDYGFKLVRQDAFHPLHSVFGGGLVSFIFDFQSGVEYVINQHEGNCSVNSIPDNPGMYANDNYTDVSHRMEHAYQLIMVKKKTYVYQGKRMLRGLVVDAWGNISGDGIVQELYFLPPQTSGGPPPPGRHPHAGHHPPGRRRPPGMIPEQLSRLVGSFTRNNKYKPSNSQQTQTGKISLETTFNIYNYMQGHPDLSVFDISLCYPEGTREMYLQFIVPGKYSRDVSGRKAEFYTAVRKVMAKVAGISLLRIGSLHIQQSYYGDDKLLVVFSLLDKTPGKAGKGPQQITLDEAYKNLTAAMNDRGLAFTVGTGTHKKWYYIQKGSIGKTSNPTSVDNSGQYSAASMTGLGIGMILLGCILGLLIAFIIYRRVSPPFEVPYERSH